MSPKVLADRVIDQFVDAVGNGEFPPEGLVPNEAQLAERWQVSRLTVREAIRSLMELGVVEIRRGRGTFVRPPSNWSPLDARTLAARVRAQGETDVHGQLLEARLILESGVAELAAARRRGEHLERLGSAVEEMARALDEPAAFARADLRFHDVLFDAAGNLFIGAIVRPIHDFIAQARRATSDDAQARTRALRAHRTILAAVAEGDCESARHAMTVHITETAALTLGPPGK
ncbi:MAG TPA: FadR/GntR family transcriptional regulator [Acidimicrobiales bacterium]|nr:FadR/GntR family transcriptional regulator [Acidimicrobiales bacterium]